MLWPPPVDEEAPPVLAPPLPLVAPPVLDDARVVPASVSPVPAKPEPAFDPPVDLFCDISFLPYKVNDRKITVKEPCVRPLLKSLEP
jgi:hypothetical protein